MVERVARAIHDASHKELGFSWAKEMRMAQARAAIEAMREPDFLMKMAGASAITVEIMEAKANYDGACDAWQAMITAALGDG